MVPLFGILHDILNTLKILYFLCLNNQPHLYINEKSNVVLITTEIQKYLSVYAGEALKYCVGAAENHWYRSTRDL